MYILLEYKCARHSRVQKGTIVMPVGLIKSLEVKIELL